MATLDHIIVRVHDAAASAHFYSSVLGFRHEGTVGPFEVVRVNAGLTLDLMQSAPNDPQHLAFELPEPEFSRVFGIIKSSGLAYGSGPFARESKNPGISYGARGNASAVYFSDPDGHSLEIRLYRRPET